MLLDLYNAYHQGKIWEKQGKLHCIFDWIRYHTAMRILERLRIQTSSSFRKFDTCEFLIVMFLTFILLGFLPRNY